MNGLTIQWGTKNASTYDVTFWFSFNVTCMYFNFIANRDRSTDNGWHYYHSLTNSGCKIMSYDEKCLWYAVGY